MAVQGEEGQIEEKMTEILKDRQFLFLLGGEVALAVIHKYNLATCLPVGGRDELPYLARKQIARGEGPKRVTDY